MPHSLLLTLCLCVAMQALAAADFYVSTHGSDKWSGALAAPNPDRTDGPFATLERAREAVRSAKAKPGARPIVVEVRAGTYPMAQPFSLGPEDSGTAERPIVYQAYRGEEVTLSGGRLITGWRKGDGPLWVADLPDVKAGRWHFRQLFVAGERQVRARTPNADPSDPIQGGWAFVVPDPTLANGLDLCLACIHTRGDTFEWEFQAPSDGDYAFWMYYGAKNKPFGRTDMAGRTSISIDGGEKLLLDNLPDTGDWGRFTWKRTAAVKLTQGAHRLRWTNEKGGGLNWRAWALCTDPSWQPKGLPPADPATGSHLVMKAAAKYDSGKAKEHRVTPSRTRGRKDRFHFRPGDLRPWPKSPEPEIHIFPAWGWVNAILCLDRIDPEQCLAYVKNRNCTQDIRLGNRYFVENVREALDSPGEWYLDRGEGRLYYWPRDPNFNGQGVVAPALDRVVDLAGDIEGEDEGQIRGPATPVPTRDRAWVEHVTLRGFTFRHTTYSLEIASVYTPDDAALWVRRGRHCTVEDCRFLGVGGYGVRMSLQASHNRIVGNTIADAGQGGVLLKGYTTASQPHTNVIAGNRIHHCGRIWKHVAAIYVTTGSRNRIAHNTITDVPRYGISLKSFRAGSASHDNVVEYNRIVRTNLETNDTGGIETLGRDREDSGNVIRCNLILDSVGLKTTPEAEFLSPYYTWGIYLDDFSSGTTVAGNIVARTYRGGFHVHLGFNNVFEDNIFVDAQEQQCEFNGRDRMRNNVVRRNIFYFHTGSALRVRQWHDEVMTECDHNVYWMPGAAAPPEAGSLREGEDAAANLPKVANLREVRRQDSSSFTPKGTWAEWQAAGYDTHSIVADPLFVDPSSDDYRLRAGSPALGLGFGQTDVTKIGARGYERGMF